jgi:hypothetical protein
MFNPNLRMNDQYQTGICLRKLAVTSHFMQVTVFPEKICTTAYKQDGLA